MHGCRTHSAPLHHKYTISPQHLKRLMSHSLTSACKPIKLISKPAVQPCAWKTALLLMNVKPEAFMASMSAFRSVTTEASGQRLGVGFKRLPPEPGSPFPLLVHVSPVDVLLLCLGKLCWRSTHLQKINLSITPLPALTVQKDVLASAPQGCRGTILLVKICDKSHASTQGCDGAECWSTLHGISESLDTQPQTTIA
jgi:hypothetical protein